jgi:hypothetical protein
MISTHFSIEATSTMKAYPDISSILDAKARRRVYLARLSFEEKIAVVDKWRKLTRLIQKNRPSENKPQAKRD